MTLRASVDGVAECGCGSLVGESRHPDTGLELEQLGREVRCGAVARRGVPVAVRLGVESGDQVRDGGHRVACRGDQDGGGVADEPDGGEVGDGVVGEGLQGGVHPVGGDVAEQQGVPVGPGSGHVLAGDRTVGAGAVVDGDGLAEARAEPSGDGAGDGVVGATGRGRHDDREGPVGERRAPRPFRRGRRAAGRRRRRRTRAGGDRPAGSCGRCGPTTPA